MPLWLSNLEMQQHDVHIQEYRICCSLQNLCTSTSVVHDSAVFYQHWDALIYLLSLKFFEFMGYSITS